MSSTYSALKIELIGTGDQSGTWGITTNTNLGTAIEEAITGTADVSFSSSDVTLTLTDTNGSQTARNLRLNLIGTSGGAHNLTVPAIEKQYIIKNNLADAITVKCAGGVDTGVAVPAGKSMIVFNDGTNVTEAFTYTTALIYPGAGIPNSTGSAWGTSYTTSGSGTVVALATGASLTTPTINTAASVGGTWTAAAAWTIPGHSVAGDLTLSGNSYNFSGDFSNTTIANRNGFKTSTTNGNTVVGALPNGTGTGSAFQVYNNSTPTNASLGSFEANSTLVTLASSIRGSGTYLPLSVNVNGSEVTRFLTTGAISFGSSGTAYGTSGQVLTSGGSSASPTWTTLTSGTSILYGNGSGGFSNVTIGSNLSFVGGTLSATAGGSGTVTSVSWTGGIVSIANPTSTPAFTIAGTSGGIPYFSSGTTWASSSVLAANALVIGGGAGVAPSTTTTGTGVITALGIAVDSGSGGLVTNTGTATLTNKRITVRSLTLTSTSGATTPASDTYDQVNYSLTGTTSFSAPSGTPTNGQKLNIRLYAASTQTVSWTTTSTGYRVIGTTLPTSVAAGKTVYIGCVWNSTDSYWDVVAVATQA